MNSPPPKDSVAWWVKALAALGMLLLWVPFIVSETLNTLLWVAAFFYAVYCMIFWVIKLILRI
jgi:hypothetical protein